MNETADAQQPLVQADAPPASGGPSAAFFAIGIALNLALLAAFGLWAIRQWKRNGKRDP